MTKLIEELERLRDEATPGPWEAHQGETPKGWFLATVHEVVSEESAANDAALIVALVNNLPTIIAALKAAEWRPIEEAPKGATEKDPCKEHWILGINKCGEQRVIRWCMEYPQSEGCWMFAYAPTDYIDGIQIFYPIAWKPLGPGPEGEG